MKFFCIEMSDICAEQIEVSRIDGNFYRTSLPKGEEIVVTANKKTKKTTVELVEPSGLVLPI